MRREDKLRRRVRQPAQSSMNSDNYNTCIPAMGVMELEDDDVICLHALLVKPPVAFVEANLVDFINEVWVHNIHRHEVLAVDCACIAQS